MKIIHCFTITKNSNTNAGSGHTIPTSIAFRKHEDALMFAASERYAPLAVQGIVNKDCAKYNIQKTKFVIYDDIYDFDTNEPELRKQTLIKSTIAKLTKEELNALGFNR